MSASPRVSVVLATYNRRGFLCQALDSLLAQSYPDFEVIVGNDGGADYIEPVKQHFADERIAWVDHGVRKGLLDNTLDGFSRARGEFLAILQDDDRWAPDLLARLVPRLEADPTINVAFSDHFIIDRDGGVDLAATDRNSAAWGRDRLAPGVHRPFRRLAVIDGTIPIQCAAVFRRSALDVSAFPLEAGPKFDRWLSWEMARGNAGAHYEPARLAYYRSHPGQQTVTGGLENAEAGIYIFQRFLEEPELADLPRASLRALLAADRYGAGVALIRRGHPRAARRQLLEALRLRPRPRTGAAMLASLLPVAIATRL